MERARAVLLLPLLAVHAPAQQQGVDAGGREAVFRVELGPKPAVVWSGQRVDGVVENIGRLGDDALDLSDDAARVTFGPHARLGVQDRESFTLEVELRTASGGFATPLMCREGPRVHYSIVLGRAAGCASFEAWGWARERAVSTTRIDDGAWHRLRGCYDAQRRVLALEVDGVVESVVPVRAAFDGSEGPSLRLGDNLDPNVHQPFDGAIRGVALRRGLPASVDTALAARAAATVLPPGRAEAMVREWNDAHRPDRDTAVDAAGQPARARRVRALVQDALGLWPPPFSGERLRGRRSPIEGAIDAAPTAFASYRPRLPLDVVEGGTLERGGYRVVRLYWRTFERYFAGGWLYEPTDAVPPGRRPAVLSPHGHWQDGARHPVVQARCITLAGQGYVVLAVDSLHVEDDRVALSPVAAMTWANLRGLELLRARADVDPERIGCTGASGGGQQTYYLAGLDSGLAAVAPAVMVCHLKEILDPDHVHCRCNHTPGLAGVLDVPEMSAAFAPRPQLFLSVTQDWTYAFPREGYPAIATLYAALGAADRVDGAQWDQGHDYNRPMRNRMYAFFDRWLRGVDDPDPEIEPEDIAVESVATLRGLERADVPADTASIAEEFRARLAVDPPGGDADPSAIRARFAALLGGGVAAPGLERVGGDDSSAWLVTAEEDVALPVLRLEGSGARGVAVVVSDRGKADLLVRDAELVDAMRSEFGEVWLADVRYVGELDVGNGFRDLHGRFFGLDEGQLAVRDLRRLVVAASRSDAGAVALIALGRTGAPALLASALEPGVRSVLAPDLGPTWRDADRRPRLARILLHGDLPEAALATYATRVVLGGSPDCPSWQVVERALGDRVQRRVDPLGAASLRRAVGAL